MLRATAASWIQALDRNTAECYAVCLQRRVGRFDIVAQAANLVHRPWPCLRLTACDEAGANMREERWQEQQLQAWSCAKFLCQIHKAMGIATRTSVPVKHEVSGLLNLVLSIMQVGQFVAFRKEMFAVALEMLEIWHCPPAGPGFLATPRCCLGGFLQSTA